MARFLLEKKGYNKAEVDNYIQKTVSHLENKINDQSERIKQLKEEISYLYQKNDEYRRNEEKVSSALLKVMELKERVEQEQAERNELENERLKLFREKWISYAIEVQNSECKKVVDNLNTYMDKFSQELKYSLKSNLNIPSKHSPPTNRAELEFYKEQDRISKEQTITESREESEILIKMCRNLGLLDEEE